MCGAARFPSRRLTDNVIARRCQKRKNEERSLPDFSRTLEASNYNSSSTAHHLEWESTTASGREPRFTMCALSGRWANRARAGNGGLQAKSRIHTIGQHRPYSEVADSSRSLV